MKGSSCQCQEIFERHRWSGSPLWTLGTRSRHGSEVFHQLFSVLSRPFTVPGFCVGCDAFVLGFSAFGLRISRFDFFWLFAMAKFSGNRSVANRGTVRSRLLPFRR